jgi:hypothetical protein
MHVFAYVDLLSIFIFVTNGLQMGRSIAGGEVEGVVLSVKTIDKG